MFYKCNYCDPVSKRGTTPIKSINVETDEFVKDDRGKYYHLDCFRMHLKQRKKIQDEHEIDRIIKEIQEKSKEQIRENILKDEFLQWIMDFYDSSIPSYFLLKVHKVRLGEYEGVNEPIPYDVMLDIYKHMENYLRKRALTKRIPNVGQQMNYDLAVVLGNYGDYKKWKWKQQQFRAEELEVNRQIDVTNKVNEINKNDSSKEREEFDITDVMDDLLL